MKTTIELPDDLFVEARKFAIENRTTLKRLVERGLRRELRESSRAASARHPRIRWVTVEGGLPEGLDVADRGGMMDWLRHDRD